MGAQINYEPVGRLTAGLRTAEPAKDEAETPSLALADGPALGKYSGFT